MEIRQLEKILKALANRRRLDVCRILKKKGPLTVGEIAEEIRLSFKSTSRHLALLAAAEILEKEQKSLNVFYSLSKDAHKFVSQVINQV